MAELLRTIASMPNGAVILPPLDRTMDDTSWASLDDCHPQMGLKQLLKRLGKSRHEVKCRGGEAAASERTTLISNLMRPAATSDQWQKISPQSVEGITAITSSSFLQQEAMVIASMMRETLETKGRTATLITGERPLARRVVSLLQRWGIACDDSAGMPLSLIPAAVYLRLLAEMVDCKMTPVPLLSALKHPLATGGMQVGSFRRNVRELELAALRGVRVAPEFAGLYEVLDNAELHDWLMGIEKMAQPFMALMERKEADLHALLTAHLEFAELLAASEESSGDVRLWAGDDGERVSGFYPRINGGSE